MSRLGADKLGIYTEEPIFYLDPDHFQDQDGNNLKLKAICVVYVFELWKGIDNDQKLQKLFIQQNKELKIAITVEYGY
ncbi:hypothetical protein HI914_02881 [Erysiphe necator]|nr:hypothetical protein HI914_02881 [Erysiphe necator]